MRPALLLFLTLLGLGPIASAGHPDVPGAAYRLHDVAADFASRVNRRDWRHDHSRVASIAVDFSRATWRFHLDARAGAHLGELWHAFRDLERCFAELRHAANRAGLDVYTRHGRHDPLFGVAEALGDLRRALHAAQRNVSVHRDRGYGRFHDNDRRDAWRTREIYRPFDRNAGYGRGFDQGRGLR